MVRPDGYPVVVPTAVARDGDRLLVHGSAGSRWISNGWPEDGAEDLAGPAWVGVVPRLPPSVTSMSDRDLAQVARHRLCARLNGLVFPQDKVCGQGQAVTSRLRKGASGTMKLVSRILGSKILRWGYMVLVIAFAVYYIADKWHDIRHALSQIGLLTSFEALLAVIAALIGTMFVWQALITGLGSPLSVSVTARILFIGQLGKYLPGSVWPVLAQMELGAEHKVPRARAAAATVISMCLSLLCALLVAFVTLPFTSGFTKYWWAFLIAVPLLVCLYPRVLNKLLNFGFKLLRRDPLEQPVPGKAIAIAFAWYVVTWIFYGLHVWVQVIRLGAHPGPALVLSIGAFAFAWSVGFVIVLAPAGAGFRDALLILLLTPSIGSGPATAITLVSRVVTTLGDVICAGGAVISYRREKARRDHADAIAQPTLNEERDPADSPLPVSDNSRD